MSLRHYTEGIVSYLEIKNTFTSDQTVHYLRSLMKCSIIRAVRVEYLFIAVTRHHADCNITVASYQAE